MNTSYQRNFLDTHILVQLNVFQLYQVIRMFTWLRSSTMALQLQLQNAARSISELQIYFNAAYLLHNTTTVFTLCHIWFAVICIMSNSLCGTLSTLHYVEPLILTVTISCQTLMIYISIVYTPWKHWFLSANSVYTFENTVYTVTLFIPV